MTTGSTITSRPYGGLPDLLRMEAFLAASAVAGAPSTYWHVGNLLWSMYWNPAADLAQSARLWETAAGELLGFAWFDEPGELTMQVHPRWYGSGLLEEQMLAWVVQRARQVAPPGQAALSLFVGEDDTAYLGLLARHGFARGAWSAVHMERDLLHAPTPALPLPDGITVRPVAGEQEYGARVAVHQEAFHPSQFTLAAYRRLRAAPGYAPDLDLVAVTPDGVLAAYALCWYDPRTRIGLFEPVATRPRFQRRGIATAVMQEGLRRLRARGARTAALSTGAAADAAVKLYAAVGFRTVRRADLYSTTLAPMSSSTTLERVSGQEAITFRRYRDTDHDAVWAVFSACTAQLGFLLGPWDDDMHHIAAHYLAPDGEFLVGACAGRIVAFGGLRRDAPERAAVRRVGVHPDVQRRGYGRALMAELETRARAMGIAVLHLDTSITQVAAQQLYQACGYEEAGHVVMGGVECILYQKTL